MKFENIIFDLDGTLIDSSEGIVEAVNYSLRMMNQPEQPDSVIRPFIGDALSKMYPAFTDAPIDELCHHFKIKAADTVVRSTKSLEHVDSILPELKSKGFRMSIASTKISRHIEDIIDILGWSEYFEVFVGGDDVKQVKPHPEAFRLALSRMGATPENSLVVGDTINDVLAAKDVPVKVIAVKSPYGGSENLRNAEPDHFINNITELSGLLSKLN